MIVTTTRVEQTVQFQALVPNVVQARAAAGKRVVAVDFTKFPATLLRDGIQPADHGYGIMGDWWYNFMPQIPYSWISIPEGSGLVRNVSRCGGHDENVLPLR